MLPAILIPAIQDIATRIIDKVLPDEEGRTKAKIELSQIDNSYYQDILSKLQSSDNSQTEINKIDAASQDKFQSRWRPFFGWVSGIAYAYALIVQPLLEWSIKVILYLDGKLTALPESPIINIDLMMFGLTGILGLGLYRSAERITGKIK